MKPPAPIEFVITCHSWQQAHHIADLCMAKRLASGIEFIAAPGGQKEDAHPVQLVLQVAADKRSVLKALMEEMSIHVVETTHAEI